MDAKNSQNDKSKFTTTIEKAWDRIKAFMGTESDQKTDNKK